MGLGISSGLSLQGYGAQGPRSTSPSQSPTIARLTAGLRGPRAEPGAAIMVRIKGTVVAGRSTQEVVMGHHYKRLLGHKVGGVEGRSEERLGFTQRRSQTGPSQGTGTSEPVLQGP